MTTGPSTEGHDAAGKPDSKDQGPTQVWSIPQPERIPRPTAAPAAAALGITLIAFGGLTSGIVSVAGALLAGAAAAHWIREMHDAAGE